MKLRKHKKIEKMGGAVMILVILVILGVCLSITISEEPSTLELKKGKNKIRLNTTELFYVSHLVKLNPEIKVVSYKEGNESIGYVNVFGGIGKDFVMEPREYEIIVDKNITLILPYR